VYFLNSHKFSFTNNAGINTEWMIASRLPVPDCESFWNDIAGIHLDYGGQFDLFQCLDKKVIYCLTAALSRYVNLCMYVISLFRFISYSN